MSTATPASRRPDGRPETPAETRFFDLRGSGYTGAIDQDGYAVADVDAWLEQHRPHMSNPGPVEDICQDDTHRVGASNTQLDGGNPMVEPAWSDASTPAGPDVTPALLARNTLIGCGTGQGKTVTAWPIIAGLRVEIEKLREERAELMRQVEDLAWDLNDVLSGRSVAELSSVGALFTEQDELGGA